MRIFTSPKQKIGSLGEQFAKMFLVKQGFTILESNFSCRFGEIDIISKKGNKIHFIEVKSVTVTHETNFNGRKPIGTSVSHETQKNLQKDNVSRETFLLENRKLGNPFQNVSFFKIKRLLKTAEIYLNLRHVPRETRWQVDGVGVYLNKNSTLHNIEYIENITIL